MKKLKSIRKPLIFSLFGLILVLTGFGTGRLTVPSQELESQPGILIIDPYKRLKVNVYYVIDGDSLDIIGGERIRLLGIDAPEVNEPNGEEALEELQKLVENEEIELEFDPEAQPFPRDNYGRLLAYVWIGDTLVNEALIKKGVATLISEEYLKNLKYKSRFLEAQKYAQKNKLGMWAD